MDAEKIRESLFSGLTPDEAYFELAAIMRGAYETITGNPVLTDTSVDHDIYLLSSLFSKLLRQEGVYDEK